MQRINLPFLCPDQAAVHPQGHEQDALSTCIGQPTIAMLQCMTLGGVHPKLSELSDELYRTVHPAGKMATGRDV